MHIKGMSIPMTMITLMIKSITLMTIMTTGTATRFLTGTTMTTPKIPMKGMIRTYIPMSMITGTEKLKTVHLRTYTTTVMIFFMRTIIPTIRSMRVWYIRFSVIPCGTGLALF